MRWERVFYILFFINFREWWEGRFGLGLFQFDEFTGGYPVTIFEDGIEVMPVGKIVQRDLVLIRMMGKVKNLNHPS